MKTAAIETDALPANSNRQVLRHRAIADFAELIKARLTLLVLLTTAVGFYLGAPASLNVAALFHAVFGTALAAAGAAALNQWWERRADALMHRTKMRPIPAGRMPARDALVIGNFLALVGVSYLAITTNLLSAALSAATIVIYIFGYTPLKRISATNTLVGAVPGALPPMIGWAAACGEVSWPAWSLFAILFCWQMPHFFAIAWMYREDYARAGFRMLSSRDIDGTRSSRQAACFAALLILASVLPALLGLTGPVSFGGELFLGAALFAVAVRFYRRRSARAARALFIASVVYLPIALAVLVLTKL